MNECVFTHYHIRPVPNEVGKLFDIVKQLKDQGMAIIFISHRLEEIRAIADRVTIFRDGDLIATKKINEISNEEIINYHQES